MAYVMRISDWSSDVCSSDLSPISGRNCSRLAAARLARASTTGKAPKAWLAASISGVNLPANQLQMWRSAFFTSQLGRESCWERVCQYVYISVVSESLKTNNEECLNKK